MSMPKRRTYLLGVAVATAAAWATAVVPSALAGGAGGARPNAYVSADPTSAPSSPSDDPSPSDSPIPPIESCDAPLPTMFLANLPVGRLPRITGPVTCDDGTSYVTVSWDGATIKIVIKATRPSEGQCAVDPDSVAIGQPRPPGAKVNALGEITIPYEKEKKEKITIKIQYTVICYLGGVRSDQVRRVDVEFTPPSGPVVIDTK
jgi:hypothetical protein